jgi:hypothetical protein
MTIINREELLSKLQTVAPALAGDDMLLSLRNYLLDGKRLIAFNDRIGLAVPLPSEFIGAVPGASLLDGVAIAKHAEEIKLEANGNEARLIGIKGRDRNYNVGLPLLAADSYQQIFSMPARPRDGCPLDDEFFTAIDNCLQSVAKHSTVPETTGITLIPNHSQLDLFATDRMTMTRAKLKKHSEFNRRVTLSAEFCEQLLRLREAKNVLLSLKSDHVLVAADKTTLFGRLLQVDGDPIDYAGILKRHTPNSFPNGVPKPKDDERFRIGIALSVANRFSDSKVNDRIQLKISGGQLSLSAANVTRYGSGNDAVPFAEHPDASSAVAIGRICEQFERYERMLVRSDAVLLSKGQNLFMASARGGSN